MVVLYIAILIIIRWAHAPTSWFVDILLHHLLLADKRTYARRGSDVIRQQMNLECHAMCSTNLVNQHCLAVSATGSEIVWLGHCAWPQR
jgi:hypothetical protein